MNHFVEEVKSKNLSAIEILNFYRNLNHAENDNTEQGIIARALNEVLHKMTVVVRCKNCIFRFKDDADRYYCLLDECYCGDTDYCSRGVTDNANK